MKGGNKMKNKCKVKESWVGIEMEHKSLFPKSKQRLMARKIAEQHVEEMGCGYYPALKKMEKRLQLKSKRGKKYAN